MKLLIRFQTLTAALLKWTNNGTRHFIYNGCNCLSILGLKLIHVSKTGLRWCWLAIHSPASSTFQVASSTDRIGQQDLIFSSPIATGGVIRISQNLRQSPCTASRNYQRIICCSASPSFMSWPHTEISQASSFSWKLEIPHDLFRLHRSFWMAPADHQNLIRNHASQSIYPYRTHLREVWVSPAHLSVLRGSVIRRRELWKTRVHLFRSTWATERGRVCGKPKTLTALQWSLCGFSRPREWKKFERKPNTLVNTVLALQIQWWSSVGCCTYIVFSLEGFT